MSIRNRKRVQDILKAADAYKHLSDAELAVKMQSLRTDHAAGALVDAFALVYLAFQRTIGITPYPEQMMGALAMCEGCIAQIQTGEGKTATAVFAASFFALSGKSVCIATVNPYLARRDMEWMEPVYTLLGFTVGLTEAAMENPEKQEAYQKDILYGTHSEFGFDYLRDQLMPDPKYLVQREPFFMLVDEADSILLDEAVTPMILSGHGVETDPRVYQVDRLLKWLKPVFVQTLDDEDYEALDEKYDYIVMKREKVAILTSLGARHASQYFPREDFDNNVQLNHLLFQALQAHGTMRRDVDYIVNEGKLFIVDPNTGRVAEGRRFCDGLWQALEVKEGLEVLQESTTLASISYQQFFKRYPHLCGMTGTAKDERRELENVYKLPVEVIPPHKKNHRVDFPDVFCANAKAQLEAVAGEVSAAHKSGQPCLIVTRSVADNERMAEELQKRGLRCEVLSAKSPEGEAAIIARAGEAGSVTVATAMAGRGTDIKPDEKALAAGGLYVIGFGHQNTRRGDRQLMGRSGRQGDVGKTRFFVSPEDDLLARFCPDKTITGAGQCLRAVRLAQRNCEATGQAQRKSATQLDEIIGKCRESFYGKRSDILNGILPERFIHKPPELMRAVILKEMDRAWAVFLSEADVARQNSAAVSLTGHDAKDAFIRHTAELFDEIFSDMRENIEKQAACIPNRIEIHQANEDEQHVDSV